MKKTIFSVAAAAIVALSASTAGAIQFTDIDNWHIVLGPNNPTKTSDFDLTEDGFNPVAHEIISAEAIFHIADDISDTIWKVIWPDPNHYVVVNMGQEGEEAEILLGGSLFDGTTVIPLYTVGGVTLGGSIGTLIVALNETGRLSYSVTAVTGDFVFKSAQLTATAVPDGASTLALLGLGLLGLAAVRRKRA